MIMKNLEGYGSSLFVGNTQDCWQHSDVGMCVFIYV
jgi:hypothetical protein